jgi:hypothetical protein
MRPQAGEACAPIGCSPSEIPTYRQLIQRVIELGRPNAKTAALYFTEGLLLLVAALKHFVVDQLPPVRVRLLNRAR